MGKALNCKKCGAEIKCNEQNKVFDIPCYHDTTKRHVKWEIQCTGCNMVHFVTKNEEK